MHSLEWMNLKPGTCLNGMRYFEWINCFVTSVFWYPKPHSSSSSETTVNDASIGWILMGCRVVGTWSVSILGDLAYILTFKLCYLYQNSTNSTQRVSSNFLHKSGSFFYTCFWSTIKRLNNNNHISN